MCSEGRNLSILFVLFLLAISSVHAYGVEKVWIEWNGNTVKTISPTASLPGAVLKIKLTADAKDCLPGGKFASCTLSVRAAALSTNPAEQQFLNATSIDVKSCGNSTAGILCTSQPFTFSTKAASNPVLYLLKTRGSSTGWQTVNVPILIDETAPKAVQLDVGYCDEEQCYASTSAPTPFKVRFDDTKTSFEYKQVFVGSAGQASVGAASSCTGNTCIGEVRVPCRNDGDQQSIEIISVAGIPSAEDAQNPVEGMSRSVTCTSQSPKFIDTFTSTASGTLGVPTAGGSTTYVVHARVPHGKPRASLVTESINGVPETLAVCSQEGEDQEIYKCTWTVNNLKPGSFDLKFTVADETGNRDVYAKTKITILNITGPVGNKSVDRFSSQVKQVIPERINRLALDLAASNSLPYPAYVVYDLQPKAANVHVVRQELDKCWYKLPNETNFTNSNKYNLFSRDSGETRVLYPARDHNEDNRLNIQLRPNKDVLKLSDSFDVTCQLKLVVTEGDTVYGTPELENISFKVGLRESALGQPGQTFVDEIKKEEKKLSGPDQKFISTLREVQGTLDGVCQIMNGLQGLDTTGASIGLAGQGLINGVYTAAIGQTLLHTGNTIKVPMVGQILEKLWYPDQTTKKDKFLRAVCKQVNCQGLADGKSSTFYAASDGWGSSLQGKGQGSTTTGGAFVGFLRDEATKNVNSPNFEDSLVSSIMYRCVGGIVYNIGKWQDINCGYLECLKEQSINGGSVAVCEQARSYKMCTQLTGEVFELPYARVVKNMAANIDGMIDNAPGFLVKFFGNQYCKKTNNDQCKASDWTCTGCHVFRAVINTMDYAQTTNQMFNKQFQPSNICPVALCNAKNGKDCEGRSYNKIQKYSKYTSYLQVNTWLAHKAKQSATRSESSSAKELFTGLQAEGKKSLGNDRGYFITKLSSADSPDQGSQYYLYAATSRNSEPLTSEQSQKLDTYMKDNNVDPTLLDNFVTSEAVVDAGAHGIVLRTAEDAAQYQHELDIHTTFGDSNRGTVQAQMTAITAYQACLDKGTQCSNDEKTRATKQLSDQKITYENHKYYFAGADAAAPSGCGEKAVCSTSANGVTEEYVKVDGKWYKARSVDESTAKDTIDIEQKLEYWQTFDFVANIAAKWAYDQGYLNFLSTSAYGDWSRDVTQWSDSYINPKGWAQNLCNDLVFDLQDADDGVILEANDNGFTKVSGTFAAEVREIENESGKSYVYIYTIYVTNPQRPVVPGQTSNGDLYNYKMDAFFDTPQANTCAKDSCDGKKDIIDGRFKLDEGASFAKGNGPRRGVLYLPVKYDRLCIAFDKPFPTAVGKKVFCREVKENVYATGSPYVAPPSGAVASGHSGASGGSTGSTGSTTTDPEGTGNLEGEV